MCYIIYSEGKKNAITGKKNLVYLVKSTGTQLLDKNMHFSNKS